MAEYGCILHAASELEVWRRLIIEDIGGRPNEWRVLFWSGFGGEGAECVIAGERCARLCRTVGPPGHFAPIWPGIGGRVAAPLEPRREPTILIKNDGEVEFTPDGSSGVSGAHQERRARPPVLIGESG